MTKISNVLKAGGLMMGLVWGMYGNTDVSATVSRPVRGEATQVPVTTTVRPKAEITQQTDYPTVMKRVTIDLTDKPSRTRSVSAPFKSDRGGDGNLP